MNIPTGFFFLLCWVSIKPRLRFVKYPAVMMNQTVIASEETTKKAEKENKAWGIYFH